MIHTPLAQLKALINQDSDGDYFYCAEAKPLELMRAAYNYHDILVSANRQAYAALDGINTPEASAARIALDAALKGAT